MLYVRASVLDCCTRIFFKQQGIVAACHIGSYLNYIWNMNKVVMRMKSHWKSLIVALDDTLGFFTAHQLG